MSVGSFYATSFRTFGRQTGDKIGHKKGKRHIVTAFASQTSDQSGDDISTRLEPSTNVVLRAGMTFVQLTRVLWTEVQTTAG